ncbi:MAG: DUF547 domain-containing protein [Alphaproteobacteria bacterium]
MRLTMTGLIWSVCLFVVINGAFINGAGDVHAKDKADAARDLSYFAEHDPDGRDTLDYALWTDFLQRSVFNTGLSERRRFYAGRNDTTGTRIAKGHQSRYGLEANRVMFSLMTKNNYKILTEYRQDLEDIASHQVEFHRLSKDEQLAFWLNLHNVVAIERIGEIYPIEALDRKRIQRIIFEEKAVTIAGVPLSLNDIRFEIVYRNWPDPKVMYGFYLGVIGGPSLQTRAFSADNLETALTYSASEFVNALRGVEFRNGRLRISRLYEEARPYFFPDWPRDVRRHLNRYAQPTVAALLRDNESFKADTYTFEIADLAGGVSPFGRSANLNQFTSQSAAMRGLPPRAWRFIEGVRQKQKRQGVPDGTVIIQDDPDQTPNQPEAQSEGNEPDGTR